MFVCRHITHARLRSLCYALRLRQSEKYFGTAAIGRNRKGTSRFPLADQIRSIIGFKCDRDRSVSDIRPITSRENRPISVISRLSLANEIWRNPVHISTRTLHSSSCPKFSEIVTNDYGITRLSAANQKRSLHTIGSTTNDDVITPLSAPNQRRPWRAIGSTNGNAITVSAANQIARRLHTTPRSNYDEFVNKLYMPRGVKPVQRSVEATKVEWQRLQERVRQAEMDVYRRKGAVNHAFRDMQDHELLPWDVSFLIIGGGIMGSSVAFWLKQRFRDEQNRVCIIEKDDTFATNSSILGIGGIRTQFSAPESIKMSMFSAEFLRHAGEHLQIIDNVKPDIEFTPMGHLFLATTDEQVEDMEKANKIQLENNAKVKLMPPDEIAQVYPFMDVSDIKLGSIGLLNEGIFDSWSLLSALREKNIALGVQYIKAEVTDFMYHNKVDGMDEITPEEDMWRYRVTRGAMVG